MFVSISDFLSDSPGDQMNLSVPPGNICDDVRTQRVVLTQNAEFLHSIS